MWVTILGAGGGATVLVTLINGLIKWLSGTSHRERIRNTNLAAQRSDAIKERDEADDKRREAEEHVAILQRQLILLGVKPLERESK
jgi:hypothetical protein